MDDRAAPRAPAARGRAGRWVAVLAALVLWALTIAVMVHPGPLVGEVAYIRWLQRWGEPAPSIARFLRTTTGTFGNVVVALVAAVPLARRCGRPAAYALAIALLSMLVIQPVFKEVVDRPRPNATQVEVRAVHTSQSFPSGHSLGTATVWGAAAGIAWVGRRRALAGLAVVPVLATGVASGVQGVHWPSDALAGTITGGFAAAAIVVVLAGAAGGGAAGRRQAISVPSGR